MLDIKVEPVIKLSDAAAEYSAAACAIVLNKKAGGRDAGSRILTGFAGRPQEIEMPRWLSDS